MTHVQEMIRGSSFTILYVRGSKADVDVILSGLSDADKDKRAAYMLIRAVAEDGPPRNIEKCRAIDSFPGLLELKAGRVRIPFFYRRGERGQIVMTHVFFKGKKRKAQAEYRYATTIRAQIEGGG